MISQKQRSLLEMAFFSLPFGLYNRPAIFERLMETVPAGLNYKICLVYIDDIIVFGCIFEKSLDNLEQVFGKLEKAGLKLKVKKCSFFKKEVLFLGYKVSGNGIHTTESIDYIQLASADECQCSKILCRNM